MQIEVGSWVQSKWRKGHPGKVERISKDRKKFWVRWSKRGGLCKSCQIMKPEDLSFYDERLNANSED